ncbi:acyl-CoA dehydrogenase family protein [Frankia sp. Cr1]|uniref:acyl-CoA dehydrogenase family protein n=1 Tax=Frankia sp. Cr1 TaxID=3073931 RepID=UPI002AD36958|nr:acyl-CoA dehydrogenase family protein [Frankia sp. Cr1]
MNLLPSADGWALARATREVLEREGIAATVRREAGVGATGARRERMVDLAELGVPAVLAPDPHGLGLSCLDATLVAEEVGRVLLAEPVLDAAVVATALLAAGGAAGTALAERILAGHVVAAFDPAPSDLAVVAEPLPPDVLLAPAPDRRSLRVHAVLGDPADVDDMDPTRPRVSRRLRDLPVVDEIEIEIAGPVLLERASALGRILRAAELVGAGEVAIVTTKVYLGGREQFGRPIGAFQAVQHQLASAWSGLQAARACVRAAAAAWDSRDRDAHALAAAGSLAAVEAVAVAGERCLHLHGGMGYAWETGMHLTVRRAEAARRLNGPRHALHAAALGALAAR